jgi:hypothetical protein
MLSIQTPWFMVNKFKEYSMKSLILKLALAVLSWGLIAWPTAITEAQDTTMPPGWGLAVAPYNSYRVEYESLPVQVLGIRAGGPNPTDKFKLQVTVLKNQTQKSIKAIKLSWFVFNSKDLDVVLDSQQTGVIELSLLPLQQARFEIFVAYMNQIPSIRDLGSRERLKLEVAVTQVYYSDGSVWQATDLPRKLDPSRFPAKPTGGT